MLGGVSYCASCYYYCCWCHYPTGDKVIAVVDDAEPENTTAKPKFAEGAGTKDNPFVLKPFKTVKAGDTIASKEVITITGITPGLKVKSVDYLTVRMVASSPCKTSPVAMKACE